MYIFARLKAISNANEKKTTYKEMSSVKYEFLRVTIPQKTLVHNLETPIWKLLDKSHFFSPITSPIPCFTCLFPPKYRHSPEILFSTAFSVKTVTKIKRQSLGSVSRKHKPYLLVRLK